jgi:hypothetical protein
MTLKVETIAGYFTDDPEKKAIYADILFSGIAIVSYLFLLIIVLLLEYFVQFCGAKDATFFWLKVIFSAGTIIKALRIVILDVINLVKDFLKETRGLKCVLI